VIHYNHGLDLKSPSVGVGVEKGFAFRRNSVTPSEAVSVIAFRGCLRGGVGAEKETDSTMVMNSPEGSLAGPPRRDRRSFKSPNMAILRRGRHPRARHGSSSLLAPTFLLDSEEGSCWCFDDQALGRRLEVSDPLFESRSTK
jgi:hypothetical protein